MHCSIVYGMCTWASSMMVLLTNYFTLVLSSLQSLILLLYLVFLPAAGPSLSNPLIRFAAAGTALGLT